MNSEELARLLPQVCALAQAAGEAILEVLKSGYEVYEKADRSPVTTADLVAHQKIEEGLQNLGETWPLLSEESGDVSWETRRQWETYWLVDPLDGTREVLRGSLEFTVNIALIYQHESVLGVIGVPDLGRCYYAHRGGGADRKGRRGRPEPVPAPPQR